MAKFPARKTRSYYRMQNAVKEPVGFNVFEPIRMKGALTKQVYWPACFQLEADEALIIETEIPKRAPYWNIQLNDPLFNAVEYVYRLSSLNAATAKISSDGKLRAVIALEDPGVPNWLDTAGYSSGAIQGRWFDASSAPIPQVRKVKVGSIRSELPADTPEVTPAQRDIAIRERRIKAQMRVIW